MTLHEIMQERFCTMAKRAGLYLSIAAFVLYILGGCCIFSGIGLIVLMEGRNLFGWGDARSLGYLLFCVGGGLSILGVLMLRLIRNRADVVF